MGGLKGFLEKYWIRKDREQFFLAGVMTATTIAAFTAAYWHMSDRISMSESAVKINIDRKLDRKEEFERLKENAVYTPKKGEEDFYRPDEYAKPKLPPLPGEDAGE